MEYIENTLSKTKNQMLPSIIIICQATKKGDPIYFFSNATYYPIYYPMY